MNKYLFFLGIHPELSTAEIRAVFSADSIKYNIDKLTKKYLFISTTNKLNEVSLISRLGGTIKIAKLIDEKNNTLSLVDFLMNAQPEGKIQFSITGAGNKEPLAVKQALKNKGRSVRYVEIKNTASILHNNLIKKRGDITIIDNKAYITVAIQPIYEMSKRDFDRPGVDSFSGMLPPKLARMMINLSDAPFGATILDAFCGSGTVLTEALAIGYHNIYGSDISKKAIEDSEANIEWYIKEKNSIQSIISEPFMGKPLHGNEHEKNLQKQAKELAQLYINSFTAFHKILRYDGTIIFIIPSFKSGNKWIKIDCIDEIKKIGFNIEPLSENSPYLRYMREDQHLARDIWKFTKNNQ